MSNSTALFGTLLVLAMAPGPSDFAVVARSISFGLTQGLMMVAGIVMADLLLIVCAIYGLAEVATSTGNLFVWVKCACGTYLIWLGISALRSYPMAAAETRSKGSAHSSFLSGLLITLGDPKAILFYMGLLPAFIDLSKVSITDTATIMLIAATVVGGVKASYAYLADRAKLLFANTNLQKKFNIAAGCVLMGTGLFLWLNI
jgi:threonine/homoserine/homoserine lactone efflux protein